MSHEQATNKSNAKKRKRDPNKGNISVPNSKVSKLDEAAGKEAKGSAKATDDGSSANLAAEQANQSKNLEDDGPTGTATAPEAEESKESEITPKRDRFIVFIGNLPYTTTTTALQKHFAKIKPASIRHITEKGTENSKGYAFLEFEAFDRMSTCLKLYHHSLFDDGKGGKPRKLNVELTAGGGGTGEFRKEKIRAKNQRLSEQRHRRAVQQAIEKKKKAEENTESGPACHDADVKRKGNRSKRAKLEQSHPAKPPRDPMHNGDGGVVEGIHPSRQGLLGYS